MSIKLINQYYNQTDGLKRVGVTNEMAIKQPFDFLMMNLSSTKHSIYVTEVTIKNEAGKNIRPDGILMTELRIHKGYVESKDTNDTLDDEINKKLNKDGYPKNNIIFQDSIVAVLIQNGVEVSRVLMNDAEKLEKILLQFINHKPEYIEKFEAALEKFKEDIPTIVKTLRNTISEEFKTNKAFIKGSEDFFEMCQKEINPQISKEDIREMIIQHILTEDLFKSIFDEADFHHENNIAEQLEVLVNTFMSRDMRQNQLGELGHYYKTLNAQAALVSDHYEKQKFLKVVYENFYKVYNPKGADKLGVVYTPNEIVRFMVKSTDYLLHEHFGKSLADKNVHILDPATGTGTFITDIIDYIPAQYLEYKYKNEIYANEVAILPYYIANLNIEYTFKQKMKKYIEFPNSCFVDTLDNIDGLSFDGKQHKFGFSSENADRIKRQNDQKISVIIGNPPYNANQINFNDNNKNREYPEIDNRIKETYVKYSSAQKTKVYDMYARFFRWATDRLDNNGIVSFVTNRSFIDSRTFDGFRQIIASEFNHIYIVDLGGDVRSNPKLSGPKHNVFAIQTGVAIVFLVRKNNKINLDKVIEKKIKLKITESLEQEISAVSEPVYSYGETEKIYSFDGCRILYCRRPEEELAYDKLRFLSDSDIDNLAFDNIIPDYSGNWINLYDQEWSKHSCLIDKDVKFGKNYTAIFKLFTNGIATNRDEWVYDFSKENLENKAKFLSNEYNSFIKNEELKTTIKLSRDLEKKYNRNLESRFDKKLILSSIYRPFSKKQYYSEKIFSDVLTQNHYDIFGSNLDKKNKLIFFNGANSSQWSPLSSDKIVDLNCLYGGAQCLPQFRYDNEGNQHENITDWGLRQFTQYYNDEKIVKEDIFYYTYSVLHNPAYRTKYDLNLKREFPRLPFYDNFFQWVTWGKQLMDLHIDYETVAPYDLRVVDNSKVFDKKYKLKVKLKANPELGIIEIDEQTYLLGIPNEAWQYKLGNRCAIDWVLDQYKEKKIADETVAQQFDNFRFADYKDEVIELLKKVCTVSVETMKIVNAMATS